MIYIFTQYDPFFTGEFLRAFDQKDLSYTIIDMPNFKSGKMAGLRKAISLYGWVGFLKLLLIYLFRYSFSKLKNAIDCRRITSEKEVENILKNLGEEDVVLSLSAPTRLPVELIENDIIKLNFHCGSLPKYAGMMPIFWQLFHGEEYITITVHDLAFDIDAGEILGEYKLNVEGTLFAISQNAKRQSAEIFYNFITSGDEPKSEKISARSQPSLTKFPSGAQVKELSNKMRLI